MKAIVGTSRRGSRGLALASALLLSAPAVAEADGSAPPSPLAEAPATSAAPSLSATLSRRDLSDLKKEFRKADTQAARIELLKEMAKVAGASPDQIADALELGLEDDSFLVQARAAKQLGALIENEAALTALLDAGRSFTSDRAEAMQMPKLNVPKLGDKDGLEKLRLMQEQLDKKTERLKGLVKYEKELIGALLSSEDERCVEVFGEILQAVPLDPYGEDIVKWLFHVGTTSSLDEVMDFIPVMDKQIKSREKERKKLARTRPERTPREWKGTKDAWKAREQGRIDGLLSRFDEGTQNVEGRLNEFGALVRGLAKKMDLAPAPDKMDARAWAKWWRSERAKLKALESADD